MTRNLLKKSYQEISEERISEIKQKLDETLFKENMHKERDVLMHQVQTIKLEYEDLKGFAAENILFYLNYNTKFALNSFKQNTYKDRLFILNKLLTVDMANRANKIHFADFLIWSFNYLYRDEDMAKLVEYFCNNTNYAQSYLVKDVYSVYERMVDGMKCKDILNCKCNELEKIKENKMNSRIIL